MTRNQALITGWLAREDTRLVLTRLQTVADELQKDYDTIDFVTQVGLAINTQATRDVIQNTIPRIIEQLMNEDKPEPRWTFKAWFAALVGGPQ